MACNARNAFAPRVCGDRSLQPQLQRLHALFRTCSPRVPATCAARGKHGASLANCGPRLDSAYLIGGETLLYPSLEPAMEAMRRCFPTQKLYIFTNGINLPKMPASFWETARRTRFILAITRYPIKFDYDAAIELCRSNGVEYSVFADRNMGNSFFRFALDPHKKQNRFVSHLKCYNRGCLSVIGDRLYPCSISGCVSHLNKAFGTEFKHCRGDYLIVPEIESVRQILRLRDNPVPFCSYCILPPGEVKYGPSRRKIEEWVEK